MNHDSPATTTPTFAPGPISDDVLFARHGRLGRIRLHRPRAINALTHEMVLALLDRLAAWSADDGIDVVAIDGSGERGLCAGADVRRLRDQLLDGDGDGTGVGDGTGTGGVMNFFADEYRLNATIHDYPKPYVAIMDGVVMGGGLGVSTHGSLRLVTERSRVAMPETAIGFFPDVGVMHLLARAPGELGTHLALTGATVTGADAVLCGLADAVVETTSIPAILAALAGGTGIDDLRRRTDATQESQPVAPLAAHREWIDACYAGDDPSAVVARLRARPEAAAREAADVITARSPLAVAVSLAALRRAARMSVHEVLAQDLRGARALMAYSGGPARPVGSPPVGGDFVEGVRAVLVDRDRSGRWLHDSLDDVDPALVTAILDSHGAVDDHGAAHPAR